MSAPENPAAFPFSIGDGHYSDTGMSLRDWFAGQALAGLMANANMPFAPDYVEVEPAQIASGAFDIADAMLAERERKA